MFLLTGVITACNSRQWWRDGFWRLGHRSFWRPPLHLEVGPLEVGPLEPSQEVWRSAVGSPVVSGPKHQPPTILMHFEELETLLMTSHLQCAFFYVHDLSFHAHPWPIYIFSIIHSYTCWWQMTFSSIFFKFLLKLIKVQLTAVISSSSSRANVAPLLLSRLTTTRVPL